MAHDYKGAKKIALKTIIILGVVTVIEVMIALTGKGYIIEGYHAPKILMNSLMISMKLASAHLRTSSCWMGIEFSWRSCAECR